MAVVLGLVRLLNGSRTFHVQLAQVETRGSITLLAAIFLYTMR